MIESSSICPSAWDSDIFQDFNGCIPDIPSLFDINEFPDTGSGDLSPYSNEFSSSSDDLILNELNLDITEEFVSEILQETNAGFSDLDWLSFKDSPKKSSSNLISTSSPGTSKSKHGKPSEHLQSSKLWSEMSETEQLETLHALSDIVTFHMCIREQMEVIKIIDPSAIISPDDKEFALDSTYLDDIKLERIKDFLRKQTDYKKSPKSLNYSSLKSSKKVNNSSKLMSRKSNNLSYSRTKRKQKKEDTLLYSAEDKQLKLKRQKQTRKEQRSGFFVYEKKMKLENPQGDDEDVNILE